MDNDIQRPLSHVRSTLVFPIFRYALIMLIVSFAAGVLAREFSYARLRGLPLATQWLAGRHLAELHGHILVLGFALPSGLGLITYALRGDVTPVEVSLLQSLFAIIVVSSLATLLLSLYQGVAMVMVIGGNPALSVDEVHKQLFFGNIGLRTVLYTVSHTALGISTSWYAAKLYRILRYMGNGRHGHAA